jgi:hypothetical protein
MLIAAASTAPAAEKLRHIPMDFWWRIGVAVLAIVAAVILLRKLARVNKVVLAVVVLVVLSIIGFNWIYERNEPAWATPVIEKIAEFLPSKAMIEPKKPAR